MYGELEKTWLQNPSHIIVSLSLKKLSNKWLMMSFKYRFKHISILASNKYIMDFFSNARCIEEILRRYWDYYQGGSRFQAFIKRYWGSIKTTIEVHVENVFFLSHFLAFNLVFNYKYKTHQNLLKMVFTPSLIFYYKVCVWEHIISQLFTF